MKNTTFRKKALLSSVCMLLVALVALGSATFAWFTASTTATASGINVKTVQASELQVASKKYQFTDTLKYDYANLKFKPASSADGSSWFTAEAAKKGEFTAKDGFSAPSSLDNYVYVDELNIRNNGAAAVDNVTVTFTFTESAINDGMNYARIALVPISAHNGTPTAEDFVANVYDKDGVAYNAVDSATTANTSITPSTTYTVNVGSMAGKTAESVAEKNYALFVWFEGQDVDCYDFNAGNALPDIEFQISGQTVTG